MLRAVCRDSDIAMLAGAVRLEQALAKAISPTI